MPHRNKNRQKSDQLELVDRFVNDWVVEHNLPPNPGQSDTERRCATFANSARDRFKAKRNEEAVSAVTMPGSAHNMASATSVISSPSMDAQNIHLLDHNDDNMSAAASTGDGSSGSHASTDHSGHKPRNLSAAQKYNIRLNNNRRSAHATKVYNEIYRREISRTLLLFEHQSQQNVASSINDANGQGGGTIGPPTSREIELDAELTVSRRHNTELINLLTTYKLQNENLQIQLRKLGGTSSTHPTPQTTLPTSSTQIPTKLSSSEAMHAPIPSSRSIPSNSQSQLFIPGTMSDFIEPQNQEEEEGSNRVSIISNVPASSSALTTFLGSQPNQPDGMQFRTSMGSDDMFEPNDYFSSSQGIANSGNARQNN